MFHPDVATTFPVAVTENQSTLILKKRKGFPKWDDNGIAISRFISYIHGLLNDSIRGRHQPTALYIVDGNGTLWTSARMGKKSGRLKKRIQPSESLSVLALAMLQKSIMNNETSRWPALAKAIQNGGFPFLAYYKDFIGCNTNNWKINSANRYSIPIFTLCARLDCEHAFPWPTYESITKSKAVRREWEQIILENRQEYSSSSKIPRAIWRGSLTGTNNKLLNESTRWQLCHLAKQQPLVDARLIKVPVYRRNEMNLSDVNGLSAPMNMRDFQRYIAVIDVDGHAWSSRFAELLCMDSVVLKVQPTWVDYFYHQLVPWTHYIPVRQDLSDLVAHIEWVISHPNQSRAIVESANRWCSQKLLRSSLAIDVLDIWNEYVMKFDRAETTWSDIWRRQLRIFLLRQNEIVRIIARPEELH